MSKTQISEDKLKDLATAYESLLDKTLQQTVHSIDSAQDDLKTLGQLTVEETTHLKHALKRDLSDAAQHLQASKQELNPGWVLILT